MKMDFRLEYQVDWVRAEADRIRASFGNAITVVAHMSEGAMGVGKRVISLSDPSDQGTAAAICITKATEEGSRWKVELLPALGDDDVVPVSRPIGAAELEMRYGKCYHISHDETVGKPSGEDGWPDLGDAVAHLIAGKFKVAKKRSLGGTVAKPYAAL